MPKKTVLITGCRGGFGRAVAIKLAENGHTVIATTHYQKDADELSTFAKKELLDITAFKLDITNPKDRQQILKYDLDVLVNNAGMGESGSLAEIEMDKVRENFEVNVFATFELTQLALKNMIAKNSGSIIIVSSILGRITSPFLGPYSMTKFALESGAEALALELKQITKNVHVSLIEPGAYHTGFNQGIIAKKFKWMDTDSYFYSIKEKIRRREDKQFALLEEKSIDSIVTEIVKAVEANKPKLRYSAPWLQATAVKVARILGK